MGHLRAALLLVLLPPLALACGRGGAAPGPGFTLAVAPPQVRLLPGLSRSLAVDLQPEPGFSGTVELSVSGLGPGVQGRFAPGRLALADGLPAHATLVLTAAEEAAPGTQTLTLEALSAAATRSAAVALEVPAASFFTVLTYRGVDPAPFAFLAYQDGDGPWTAVPGTGGLYRLPITDAGGRFGVLLGDACSSGGYTTWITNGFFSTLGEVQQLQALIFCNPQPGPPPETFDLRGALAGAQGRGVLVSANSGLWSFPAGVPDYALKLLRGSGDLVAAAYASPQDYLPSRIIVERARNTQAASTRDFDFATQGAAPLPPLPIQRPALDPDETFQGTVQYLTALGQVAILGYGPDLAAYAPFPPSAAQAGDAYYCGFQATGSGRSRSLQAGGGQAPGALVPRLPDNMAPFTIGTSGGPAPRLSLAWSAVAPAPGVHEAVLTQTLESGQVYWYLNFGSTWHRGAASLAWTQPDLSAVPGFSPDFLARPGTEVEVSLHQSGSRAGQQVLGLPGPWSPSPVPLAAPPGLAAPGARAPGVPGLRLRTVPASAALAAAPWSEYWFVNRTQRRLP